MIDLLASEVHFVDHLAPVWHALSPDIRGRFCTPTPAAARRAEAHGITPTDDEPGWLVAVASWGDLKRAGDRAVVYFEHGVGFTFGNDHPSYCGGRGRENVVLFVCPNEQVADRNRQAWPDTPAVVTGCAKLEGLAAIPRPDNPAPVVAVSFHWDSRAAPETRSAFRYYRPALPALAKRYRVIGHGHPRYFPTLARWYRRFGIEPVERFEDVVGLADVYVNDASSTMYEWAALDRPVVALNCPHYRRDVDHGLRFWQHVPGPQVDTRDELLPAVAEAIEDPPRWRQARRDAVAVAYPIVGGSAAAAARAIEEVIG